MKIIIQNGEVKLADGWLHEAVLKIEDGIIQSVSRDKLSEVELAQADEVIDARGMAILPGLVNGHTHFSQTFMRGLAGGRPLLQWLKELIWPLQAEISVEEMHLAALLGLAENIRCGATEVVDHHKVTKTRQHTQVVEQAAEQAGLRCTIARAWSNRGNNAESDQVILEELEDWFSSSRAGSKVSFASGPLTPWRCSAELLQKTHALSVQHGSFTHIHVSETAEEVHMTQQETGLRPLRWLNELGILDVHSQIVHAVWVDEEEMHLLAHSGATVVHCPVSNAILGSGVAPVRSLLDRGVRLRLGTDGPASNDTQDCFENMKMALCVGRAFNADPNYLSSQDVLSMATAGKTLHEGSQADLILLDLMNPHTAPVHDLDAAFALCARGADVNTVLVGGEFVMRDRRLVTIDEDVLLKECSQAVASLRKRAGVEL